MKLFLFGLLVAFVCAQDGGEDGVTTTEMVIMHNDVNSNYYYSTFATSSLYLPYAIGHCTTYALTGTNYMMVECTDDDTIIVNQHITDDCSDSPASSKTYNHSTKSYNCDGEDHYVDVFISPTSCEALSFHVIAALDVCVFGGSAYVSAYCSDSYAELQYYSSPTCGDDFLAATRTASETCDTNGFLSAGGATIYGIVSDCSESSAQDTTVTPGSQASIHFTIVGLFIGAVLAVLKL
jgi:hypothetical protein